MKNKNLWLLPTDKPSRLRIGNNGNFVYGIAQTSTKSFNDDFTNHSIYITNDEEIKEGDWCYYENGDLKGIHKVVNGQRPKTMILKKIILITDPDLIKDCVQAIDDDFIEWFVKNPSCEFVEIKSQLEFLDTDYRRGGEQTLVYKIIIPKEEPKQQSAVEFLVEELSRQTPLYTKKEIIEQAKEMEKQQIIDAVKWYMNTEGMINQDELAEDYYNETFKL
jgi:hypothetical protein